MLIKVKVPELSADKLEDLELYLASKGCLYELGSFGVYIYVYNEVFRTELVKVLKELEISKYEQLETREELYV